MCGSFDTAHGWRDDGAMQRAILFASCLLVGLTLGSAHDLRAWDQAPPRPTMRQPPPEGQRITARDGDVIVVENDDRVRIVRQRHAMARVIVDEARNLVVVLADWLPPADGIVDQTWRFTVSDGRWPLEARWDGEVVIEDEELPSRSGMGLTVETPVGLVQFLNNPLTPVDSRGPVAVLRFQGFAGGGSAMSFDDAERLQLSDTPPPASRMSFGSMTTGGAITGGVQGSVYPPGASIPVPPSQGANGALRVGGNIRVPRKIHHVDPVLPDAARDAGIQGIIIVEILVGPDGSVLSARVLRSIPLLDRAAIDAVRQWRFEPTLLNGQPVPVIMTVTVAFPAQG